MKEPRVLLMKYSTVRGLFHTMRKTLHIGPTHIAEILEREPRFILQHLDEALPQKLKMLEDAGVNKCVQKELMKRVPEFYLRFFAYVLLYNRRASVFKEKMDILQSTLGHKLEQEPSFPLVLIKNYKWVIKPRCEIIKRRKRFLPLHEMMCCTDEEFCRFMQITPEVSSRTHDSPSIVS